MRRKYMSEKGTFACKYCGTIYQWSDLRDTCEGNDYFMESQYECVVLDELNAEVGDKVLTTHYVGEDYAPEGFKSGIKLLWSYQVIREKRIVPGSNIKHRGASYLHYAEYKIGKPSDVSNTIGDHWDVSYGSSVCINILLGPRHIWTKDLCNDIPEKYGNDFEEYVKRELCYGEDTQENIQKLVKEGYYILGVSK